MIQANELRLGNYFLNPNTQKAQQCTCEDISDIQNGYKTRLPIPLTPEILEKCGFVDNKSNIYGNQEFIFLDFDGDHYNIFLKQLNIDGTLENILMDKEIKYIHQLQNLYFALTGEELNIQL